MAFKQILAAAFVVLCSFVYFFTRTGGAKMNDRTLKVFAGNFKPYSVDPIDYDLIVHHYIFTSVLSPIVSLYKKNEIDFRIIEKAEKFDNNTKWIISLKKDVKYSNNELISSEHVYLNFKRIAYLKKKANSSSGLFEYLVGFENLNSLSNNIEGLSYDSESVTLKFNKPMPNFLDLVSFNIYAIAHPSNFDHNSGQWIDRNIISSSGYRILKFDKKSGFVELSKVIPTVKNFNKIEIYSGAENFRPENNYDMVIGKSSDLFLSDDYVYVSGPESYTRFVRVKTNNNKSLQDIKIRNELKKIFYKKIKSLSNLNFSVSNSFFPLKVKGVQENSDLNENAKVNLQGLAFKVYVASAVSKSSSNKDIINSYDAIKEALNEFTNYGVSLQYVESDADSDFSVTGTGVLIDNPYDDIRFMFNSKHGINLPDPSGASRLVIESKEFEVQKVNEVLWKDSLIWAVEHFSLGYWINQKSRIDMSHINLVLPPTDFNYIYEK